MKKLYRRSISGLMALLICFTTILGGGITAFAASSSGEVAKSYSIGFPRSGDANLDYSGTWGHDELHYMNGWTSGEATWMTTLHTIGSFDGPACYCIEPGVPRLLEKTYTRYGEDYWKNYPSDYNSTIDADTIKTLLGRIMQYGYQGDLSLDWRSQNESDADKMAHMMATQVLVWETVVGERDANFNHVDPGSADAVKSVYRTSHPLYSRFSAYYDSIEASVQSHTVIPSFMSKTPNKAQTVELKWDGSQYTATLTDSNHVVSNYTFSSNLSDIVFTTNGDTLTITAKTAPAEPVTISASKNNIHKGVVVLKRTRFHKFRRSRKNVGTRITHGKLSAKLCGIVCQGNGTDRGIAFRCADQNFCFLCCVRIGAAKPLHSSTDRDNLFLDVYIRPPQRTQLTDAKSGKQHKQHTKLAEVRTVKEIYGKPLLLITGKHTHFLAGFFRVVDFNRRKNARKLCGGIFQNAVQHHPNVVYRFHGELVRIQQLF